MNEAKKKFAEGNDDPKDGGLALIPRLSWFAKEQCVDQIFE